MKHTYWVIKYKDGLLLQKEGFPTKHLVYAELFDFKSDAQKYIKLMRKWSSIYKNELKGCKICPVYARMEE